MLGQKAKAGRVLIALNVTGGQRMQPGDGAQEGGFARPIGARNRRQAWAERGRNILEHQFMAMPTGDFVQNEAHSAHHTPSQIATTASALTASRTPTP